ncbi:MULTISPECIES: hypothetical protein [unclassified Streptomyces]|uniref:hypothetical protein n=1 Tax=unclassified Streptomyces TaxID=2593676 RepID=UPI003801703A
MVTVAPDSAGGLAVFYRGADGRPRCQVCTGRGAWSGESVLGDAVLAAPVPVLTVGGRLISIVAGEEQGVRVNRQTAPGASGWDDYALIGPASMGLADAVRDGWGRVHLAYCDATDGHLRVASQQPLRRDQALTQVYPTPDFPGGQSRSLGSGAPAEAARSGWAGHRRTQVLDVDFTGVPAAAPDHRGEVAVFVHDTATATLRWTRRTEDGGWSALDDIAAAPEPIAGSPVASRAADGRIGVFFRAPGGELRYAAQRRDGGSGWESSRSTGLNIVGDPLVGHDADGRMAVHAIAADTTVWHLRTTSARPEGFTAEPAPGTAASLATARVYADPKHIPLVLRVDPDGQATEHLQTGAGPDFGAGTRIAGTVTGPPTLATGVHASACYLLSCTEGHLAAWTRGYGGAWSDMLRTGVACAARPCPVLLPYGRLVVFCTAPDGAVRAVFENRNTAGPAWDGTEVHHVADGAVTALCAQPDDFGRIILAYGTGPGAGTARLTLTVLGEPAAEPALPNLS